MNASPPPGAPHPSEDLPALVAGELDPATAADLARHLTGCPSCQGDLVLVAAMHNALTDAASLQQPAPPAPSRPARLRHARPRRRHRRVQAVLAVALVAVPAVLIARPLLSGPDRAVRLASVGTTTVSGTAVMEGSGEDQRMSVRVSGLAAHPGEHYEVWLLEPGALAVGVLPVGGRAVFALPASLQAGYRVVDVSLEPDDGDPSHSAVSVARGALGSGG